MTEQEDVTSLTYNVTVTVGKHPMSYSSERADSSGRGNTSYVSVEFISAAIFSAGV